MNRSVFKRLFLNSGIWKASVGIPHVGDPTVFPQDHEGKKNPDLVMLEAIHANSRTMLEDGASILQVVQVKRGLANCYKERTLRNEASG